MADRGAGDEPSGLTVAEVENLCRVAAKEAATTALEGLRALPVAERMEAMGMVPIDTADGVLYGCQEDWT